MARAMMVMGLGEAGATRIAPSRTIRNCYHPPWGNHSKLTKAKGGGGITKRQASRSVGVT